MLKALVKFFGCLFPVGRRNKKAGKSEQKIARPPLTPEEAYRKRVAKRKRKRKAQKGARRRNRR